MKNEKQMIELAEALLMVINSREDCPETSIKGRAIWVTAHNCAISCLTACDAVSAIMPPVKMGQVLWCTIPCSDVPLECKVYCICQEEREGVVLEYFRCVIKGCFGKAFSFEDVGKTIFLTKEEAIAALGGGKKNGK